MKTPPRVTNKDRKEENESEAQLPVEGSQRPGRPKSTQAAGGRRQAPREATRDMPLQSQASGDRDPQRGDPGPYHPGSRPPGPHSMERRLGASSLTQQSSSQPRYYSPFDRLRPNYASSSLGRSSGSRDSPTLSGVRDERPLGSYDYKDGGGPEKASTSMSRSLRSLSSPLYSSERERVLSSRVFVNPSFCSSALLSDHERRVGVFADRQERPLYASSFPSGQPRFATYTDLKEHHRPASATRGRGDPQWSSTSLRQDRPSSAVGPGQSAVGASRDWELERDDIPFRSDEDWRAPSENRDRPSGVMGTGERDLGVGQARRVDRELMLASAGRERPDSLMGRNAQFLPPTFECKESEMGSRDLEQQRLLGARRFRVTDDEDPAAALCEERASHSQRVRASLLGDFPEAAPGPSNAVHSKQLTGNLVSGITNRQIGPGHFEGGCQEQRTMVTFQDKVPPFAGQGQLPPHLTFSRGDGRQEGPGNSSCTQKLAGPGPSLEALSAPRSGNQDRLAAAVGQDPTFQYLKQGQGQRLPDSRNVPNLEDRPPNSACPVKQPSAASQGPGPQCPAIAEATRNQGLLVASAYPPNYTGQREVPAGSNISRDGPRDRSPLFASAAPPVMRPAQSPLAVKGLTSGVEQKVPSSGYPMRSPTTGNEAEHSVAPGFNQTTSQVRPAAPGYQDQLPGSTSVGQVQYGTEKVNGKGQGALSHGTSGNDGRPCGAALSGTTHDRPLPPPPGLPGCLNYSTGKAELQFGPSELTGGPKGASNITQQKEAYNLSSPTDVCLNTTQPSYQSWFPPAAGQALHAASPASLSSTSPQGGQVRSDPTAVQGKLPSVPVTPPPVRVPSAPPCHMQQSSQGPQLSLAPEPLQYPLPHMRYPPPAQMLSQRPHMADFTDSAQRFSCVPTPRSGVTTSYPDPRMAPRPFCTTPGQAPFAPTGNQERCRFPPPYLPSQPRTPIPGDVRQPCMPTAPLSARTGAQLQSGEEKIKPTVPVSTTVNASPGTAGTATHVNYVQAASPSPIFRPRPESVGSANQQQKPSDSVSTREEGNKLSPPKTPDAGASGKPRDAALRQGEANAPKQESKVYGPEVPGCRVEIIENSSDTDNSSDVEVIEVKEGVKKKEEVVKASASDVVSSLNAAKEPTKVPEVKAQKISIQLQEPLLMKQEACAKKQEALFRSQISANKSLEIESKKQEAGLKSSERVTKIQPAVGKKPEAQGNSLNRELLKGNQAIMAKGKKPIIAIKPITEIPKPIAEPPIPVAEIEKPVAEIEKPATESKKLAAEIEKPSTQIQKPVTEIKPITKQQEPETIFYGPSVKGHAPITKNEEAPLTTPKVQTTGGGEKTKGEEVLGKNTEANKAKEETNQKEQEAAVAEEEPKGGSAKVATPEKEPALMNEEVSSSTPEGVIDGEKKEGAVSSESDKTEKPSAAPDPAPQADDREDPKDAKSTDDKMETTSSTSYTESSDSDRSERYSFKKGSKSKSKERSHKKTSRKRHKAQSSYEDSESEDDHEVENSTDGVCLSGRGNDGQVFGIPVVFKAIGTTRTFWNIRASQVSREIEEAVGDNVINQKINRAGFLCVNVATAGDAVKLLNLRKLGGVDVETVIPSMYLRHEAKIRGVPYHFTNEQLTQYFSHAGVVSARRQLTVKRLHDGSFEEYPRSSVVLAFKPDATLPKTLELGPDRFIVEEYIEAPMQCFKCLRFGHTARNCVSVSRCKNCGARYCQEECERKTPLCANCFGPHQATYVGCPRRREVAFASLWRRTYDIHAL